MAKPFTSRYITLFFSKLFKMANSDATMVNSGFMFGFAYELNKENIAERPLTTVAWGSLYGMVMGCAAILVSSIIPPPIRFVIPGALFTSYVHHQLNPKTHHKPYLQIEFTSPNSKKNSGE